jgi:hypothetical protein
MNDLSNYSVDVLKKTCFLDELSSLRVKYPEPDNLTRIIMDYLDQRIKEIDKKYKIK